MDPEPRLLHPSGSSPTGNLFFALYPDAATAARIAALVRGLRGEPGLTGRPLTTENLHVSLHPLAGFVGSPRAMIEAAGAAAMAVSFSSFDIVFDRAGSFARKGDGRRPFALQGSEGLIAVCDFREALRAEMRKAGIGAAAPSFNPHVTMLYDRRCVASQSVDLVRWRVNEFVLVESLVGYATHAPLGRWRLGSRGRPEHVGLDRGFFCGAGMFRRFGMSRIGPAEAPGPD
ncbi:MAG: 2'-5' RNA ligase family protein [Beijerinckiaceae bacterium]